MGITSREISISLPGSKAISRLPKNGKNITPRISEKTAMHSVVIRNLFSTLLPRPVNSSKLSSALTALTMERKTIGPRRPDKTAKATVSTGSVTSFTIKAFAASGSCKHISPATSPPITACIIGCFSMLLLVLFFPERTVTML